MKSLLLLCLAAGAAYGWTVNADEASANVEVGSISGTITFDGKVPEPKPALSIKEAETEGCVHTDGKMDAADRSLLISKEGAIANVVLTIEATDVKVPEEPIVLDQKGCRFEPRVVVAPVGSTVRFLNSDETNHNIHTFCKKNQALNKNVAGGANLEQKLDKAEVIDVKCDVHTWMKSYVIVTEASHYAVTGADGTFKIEGLPAGEYKVEWWHEELGKGKETVKVEAGADTKFDQKIGAKKKSGGGRRRR